MQFNIGDTLIHSTNLIYSEYTIVKMWDGHIQIEHNSDSQFATIDRDILIRRLGISWTHIPLHKKHFNEELFTI